MRLGQHELLAPGFDGSLSLLGVKNMLSRSCFKVWLSFLLLLSLGMQVVPVVSQGEQAAGEKAQPDLVITGMSINLPGYYAGGTIAVKAGETNQGGGAAGAHQRECWVSAAQDGDPIDGNYYTIQPVPSLGAGGTTNLYRGDSSIPVGLTPGAYWFVCMADSHNEVAESDETNNRYSLAINILPCIPGTMYCDVPAEEKFRPDIESLYNRISSGCRTGTTVYNNGVFCPEAKMDHGSMAVWVVKRFHRDFFYDPALHRVYQGYFEDVPSSLSQALWIEEAYERGLMPACQESPRRFCPTYGISEEAGLVTRAEVALYMKRVEDWPLRPVVGFFADVTGDGEMQQAIEYLYRHRWTTGKPVCENSTPVGNPHYCPTDYVSRGEASALLSRSFGYLGSINFIEPFSAVANAGNLPVVIHGENLTTPITAALDSTALLSVTLENSRTLHAVVPVSLFSQGIYTLTVNSGGKPFTFTEAFSVTAPITSTQVRVMVYMACDNNLDSQCLLLFNQLELAMLQNSDLRIVVLWDGAREGDSAYYLIQPDAQPFARAAYEEGVSRFSRGEVDTGSPVTLVEFAGWAQGRYPGTYKLLSLVGHGGGWAPSLYPGQPLGYDWGGGVGGMLWDDHPGHVLSTRALASALPWITQAYGLDVIYLDACLMGSVEVVAELAPYTHYLVTHEGLTWALYPYAGYFTGINSATQPMTVATKIALTQRTVWPLGYPAQVSVFDTGAINNLLVKLDNFSVVLSATLPLSRTEISRTLSLVMRMDENTDFVIDGQDNILDLYELADLFDRPSWPVGIRNAARELKAAFNAAVVVNYTQNGTPWPGHQLWEMNRAHAGLLYFPLTDEWKRPYYNAEALPQFAAATHWDEFVQAWHAGQTAPLPPTDPALPPAPLHILLSVEPPALSPINSLIYLPLRLTNVYSMDDVGGVQVRLISNNPALLHPAGDQPVLPGDQLPADSLTSTTVMSDGFGFVLNTAARISGTGELVWLPFYTGGSAGCITMTLGEHRVIDHNSQWVNHHVMVDPVCLTSRGAMSMPVYPQQRQAGRWEHSTITLTGSLENYTATTGSEGKAGWGQILSGTYAVTVTRPLFAYAVRTVTVTAGTTATVPTVGLWAGDVDQDGDVDQRDWYLEAAAIYPVNDPFFDITGEGATDLQDTTILAANLGRADLHTTNPPQTPVQTTVSARLLAPEDFGERRSLQVVGNCVTLHAAVTGGRLQSVGLRLGLPAGVTTTEATLAGALTGGYLSRHQEDGRLYLLAAPPEGQIPSGDTDLVRLCFNQESPALVLEAERQVEWSGRIEGAAYRIFLPVVVRGGGNESGRQVRSIFGRQSENGKFLKEF